MSLTRPSTLWRYTARTLRRRPGRTVLTLVGIAIGVATAVAVSLTVEATRQAHREMFSAVAGAAALEVVAEGLGGFDEQLAERVEAVAGVRAVVPAIQSPAVLIGPAGVVPVMVVGSDPQRDRVAHTLTVRAGHLPGTKEARGIALEAGFAAASRLDLGQKARLSSAGGQVELPVVALLEPRGPAAFNGGAVACASAAVAGAFVILNAFLMSLGERRRQLAVLRALGATRRQVTLLLLREALLLGCAGTLLGVALGLGLSVVFRQVIGFLNAITLPDPGWPPGPFLLALGLGPGMALAAALVPARRAARRAPLEDLLQKGEAPGARARLWPGYIGLGLIAGLGVFVFGITRGWFDQAVATALLAPALAGYLAGWVLIVPLILGPLHRLTAAALRPLLGREGDLAFRQLARRPGRTSLTAGVLLAALVLSVGSGQQLLNNLRHIDGWIDRVISADFFVRGTWPDITVAVTTAALPDGLAAEVEGLGPAVARVDRFGYVLAQADGRPVAVMAYSFAEGRPLSLAVEQGDPEDVLRGLLRGEVALGAPLARRLGLRVGDRVTLGTRAGPRALRVAGVVAEYTGGGMALYMEWESARRLFDVQGPHTLAVTARPGREAELGPMLREFCARRGLLFQSAAEVKRIIGEQLSGVIAFLVVLLALIFVVAALGVVNTLTMNILEQTRELGVLRAIGLQRRQVRKLILSQAVGLVGICLLPGLVGGLGLAWMASVAADALLGIRIPFHIDVGFLVCCLAAALAAVVLAALLPARRAARLQVVEALLYE